MNSNLHIKDAAIFPGKIDWFSAVGNLILNFGTLEFLLFSFLEKHLDAGEFEGSKKLHFKDRLSIVANCLEKEGLPTADRKQWDRCVNELESLRQLRNHVAHGHLTVNLLAGVEPRVTISLPRDLDSPLDGDFRQLGFDELRDGLDQLSKATELFQRLSRFGE